MRVITVLDWDSISSGEAVAIVAIPDECKTEKDIGVHFAKWMRQKFPDRFADKTDKECFEAEFAWRDCEVEEVRDISHHVNVDPDSGLMTFTNGD